MLNKTSRIKEQALQKVFRIGFPSLELLGVRVNIFRRKELTEVVRALLEQNRRGWISYINVHAINLANEYSWFREYLNNSLVTYCDGQGVRLGAYLVHTHLPERIVMTDWVYDVCRLAEEGKWKMYFLGSTVQVVTKAVQTLRDRFPRLIVSGYHDGYLTSADSEEVVAEINRTKADIIVVGMGMPLQERWILDHAPGLNARLIFNAGSCFDYVAAAKRRCPKWIGDVGFEWLFRLMMEPARLWRRYLIGNPVFLYRVIRGMSQNLPVM